MHILTAALLILAMLLLAGAALTALWQLIRAVSGDGTSALTFHPSGTLFLGYVLALAVWLLLTNT